MANPSPRINLFQGSTCRYFYDVGLKDCDKVIESVRIRRIPMKLIMAPPISKSWNFYLFLNLASVITKNLRSDRQTAWFIDVHLHALTNKRSQMQKLMELMKMGCNFFLVKQLISLSLSFFMLRCSYSRKGMSSTLTVV